MPIKKVDNESDTLETSVSRSLAMALKPGRYMSIEKGANAAKEPKIKIKKNALDFAMDGIFKERQR